MVAEIRNIELFLANRGSRPPGDGGRNTIGPERRSAAPEGHELEEERQMPRPGETFASVETPIGVI